MDLYSKDKPPCLVCAKPAERYTVKGSYTYWRCPQCRLVFLSPLPTRAQLDTFYNQDYFSGDTSRGKKCGYEDYAESIKFKEPFYKFLLRYIQPLNARTALDVGAAYGDFVKFLHDVGYVAEGVEISPYAASRARERGLTVAAGSLEEFAYSAPPDKKFDLICLLDVFEHFYDFPAALAGLKKLLRNGGHLLIVTPSTASGTARVFGKHWYQFNPPQHTHLFNPQNIAALLAAHGFIVTTATHIRKKFTIKYLWHILSGWIHVRLPMLPACIGDIVFTFPFRDNMLVIVKKE